MMKIALLLIALVAIYYVWSSTEGFRSTKCFSCEAQDLRNGIIRSHGTKCFSCEAQSNLPHGTKCLSCSN